MVSPVGFRFQPTNEELVSHFLKKKRNQPSFTDPTIKEVNIYKYRPCELPGLSSTGNSGEQVWYFFCVLDQKYAKSERASRTARGGSWKKTGVDRQVKDKHTNKQIGVKKTLVFYKGCNTKKENKTNWTMHEYHEYPSNKNSPFKGETVVCRIEKKPDKKHEPSSALDDSLTYDSGNNVAEDISEVVEPPQLQQNLHLSPSSNHDVVNNNVMEVVSPLLPNRHIADVTEDASQEVQPLVPAPGDELIDCNGLDPNYLSTLQSPIYTTAGSSDSINFSSNDLACWLAQQTPIHTPGSAYSSGFSNDSTNEPNHNSLSAQQSAIHLPPGSSCSSGFSNDSTNEHDYNTFSAQQFPIHPLLESTYSSGIINDWNAWTPQFTTEQKDHVFADAHWSVQDGFSSPETGYTFPPDVNVSKGVAETVSASPNEYFPMANEEYHLNSTFVKCG